MNKDNEQEEIKSDDDVASTGKKEETFDRSNLDATSNCSFDAENMEETKTGKHYGKAILISAIVGIVLLIIGIVMFRCRKCGCEK
jgi:hypothetical protein